METIPHKQRAMTMGDGVIQWHQGIRAVSGVTVRPAARSLVPTRGDGFVHNVMQERPDMSAARAGPREWRSSKPSRIHVPNRHQTLAWKSDAAIELSLGRFFSARRSIATEPDSTDVRLTR